MQLPVAIPLGPSRLLGVWLVVVHVLAGAAVLVIDWVWPMRLLLLALLLVSFFQTFSRSRGLATLRLHLGAKGELEIETQLGTRQTARILPESLVLARLVVLVVQVEGRRRVLTIFPDATGRDAFRQLRVWLRWRAGFGTPAGG